MRDLRIAVIGAGMAGILSAIELRRHGYEDIVVHEKADRLGGTWRENTYPGIACDVPAHFYTYSFEHNPDWSHLFAPGDEIQEYFERTADKYDVRRLIRFGSEIVRMAFHDGRWHLETGDGVRDVVDVVIAATGVLHHPNVPDLDGLESFAGACFHSARWDHDVPLDGQRVGVVGTGSTAVQITGALVDRVAELSIFQRTPQWILPQENRAYSEEEKAAFRASPESLASLRDAIAQRFAHGLGNAVVDLDSPWLAEASQACVDNLETHVADPTLREQLRPDYRPLCKRLVVSGDFYDAIQHDHARLVVDAIERIEADGVRTADGTLHELDVLVLATGFRVDSFIRPTVVRGRDGVDLDDVWSARPSAYLSITVPEFPNFFMLNGPNGPVGNYSLIEVAEAQVGYSLQLIDLLRAGRAREISPTREALERYEAERVVAARDTIWATGCSSWYLDDRGVPAAWPFSYDRFLEEMAAPKLDRFDLRA